METRLPWRPTRGSLTSPSHLVRNRTLGPPLKNHTETPPSSRRGGPSSPAWPRDQSRRLSPNASGGLTPLSPPSELQEIPVAIREQSGVLCFHSRGMPVSPGASGMQPREDRKSTRLNSSHHSISYAVFCLKKKKKIKKKQIRRCR